MNGLRKTYALIACASASAVAGYAQQAASNDTVKLEKFVVTGSNTPSTLTAGEATALPVVTIDRKAIDETGYQTAADLLQKITANNGGSVPISNNGTGFTPAASSISLHGLGPEEHAADRDHDDEGRRERERREERDGRGHRRASLVDPAHARGDEGPADASETIHAASGSMRSRSVLQRPCPAPLGAHARTAGEG